MVRIRTCPRFYACPVYLQVCWKFDKKWRRYRVHNIFTLTSRRENVSVLKGFQSEYSALVRKILSLPLWPASMADQKVKALLCQEHFSGFQNVQGRVNPKLMTGSGRNSNSSKSLWLLWLPATLAKIQSCLHYFPHHNSIGRFRHSMRIVWSSPNSISSRFHPCRRNMQVWQRSEQKLRCYHYRNIF